MPIHMLIETGAFITLHTEAKDTPARRGAVLGVDDRGLTLRAVHSAHAMTEYWPWRSVIYVAEATPRRDERELLGANR
jgi:hypothetical protein